MRSGMLAITLGCASLLGVIGFNVVERRTQTDDVEGIRQLREVLDSTRAALARATTAADSASLTEQIQGRAWGIGRREYHVPPRQERLDGWWRATGPGSIGVVVGTLLVVGGVTSLRRKGAT